MAIPRNKFAGKMTSRYIIFVDLYADVAIPKHNNHIQLDHSFVLPP